MGRVTPGPCDGLPGATAQLHNRFHELGLFQSDFWPCWELNIHLLSAANVRLSLVVRFDYVGELLFVLLY